MHTPHLSHFVAIKRILRYIKGTLHYGFHFTPCPLSLVAFSDANWAGDQLNRHSTIGYEVFIGSNLVSSCAKKQHTITRSSTKDEYRALAQTSADLTWLHQLLLNLLIPLSLPHVLWCVN